MKLDRIDLAILHRLQRAGRTPVSELADAVGLSPSPCLRRVRRLEEAGLIRGYAAVLDPRHLGLGVNVFVSVTLTDQAQPGLEAFEAQLTRCPEVLECYLMTGDFDYLLRVVAPDLDAFHHFLTGTLTQIPNVANIKSSFALKQVSHHQALPLDHLADEVVVDE